MKLAKLLGLAMVAAIAAMALFGTGTASAATEQCYTKTKPCSEPVPNGTLIRATLQSEQAILKGVGVEVHCQKSGATGKITGSANEQVVGEMTSLTFEECALNSETPKNCIIKSVQTPYTVHEDQGTELGKGTMYVGSLLNEKQEVIGSQPGAELGTGCKLNVFPFTNLEGCIYKVKEEQPKDSTTGKIWGTLSLTAEGTPETSHALAEQVKLKTSFACGTEGFWNAQYTIEAEKSAGVWVPIFVI